MNICLADCHAVLAYDELKLWTEMGHDCFDIGAYVNPHEPHVNIRPPIPEMKYHYDLAATLGPNAQENIPNEVIEWADVIIAMHKFSFIAPNWPRMKHKKVVWRTIGQSTRHNEAELAPYRAEGMKIVRYSPREQTIPGYIGGDALVRFYKDPAELCGWTGHIPSVITVGQKLPDRGEFCNYHVFDAATNVFPRKVFGPDNEKAGQIWAGCPDYEGLKQAYRDHRVFFYTGTQPASYTLGFLEALMTGTPIVAIGLEMASTIFGHEQDTYEVRDFIRNGVNGFISDDITKLRIAVRDLLNDHDLSRNISDEGRATAIKFFGRDTVRKQWERFFAQL